MHLRIMFKKKISLLLLFTESSFGYHVKQILNVNKVESSTGITFYVSEIEKRHSVLYGFFIILTGAVTY